MHRNTALPGPALPGFAAIISRVARVASRTEARDFPDIPNHIRRDIGLPEERPRLRHRPPGL